MKLKTFVLLLPPCSIINNVSYYSVDGSARDTFNNPTALNADVKTLRTRAFVELYLDS